MPWGYEPPGIGRAAGADPPEEITPSAPGYSTCDRNSSPGMRKPVFLRWRGLGGARGGAGRGGARRKPVPWLGAGAAPPRRGTRERDEASAFRGKGRKRRAGVGGDDLAIAEPRGAGAAGCF